MISTDSAEYTGLLRDILENPEEDAPRLVLADWLEDQGDTKSLLRAEFIRVQIQQSLLACQLSEENKEDRLSPRRSYCNNSLCPHCSLHRHAYEIEHGINGKCDTIDIDNKRSRAFFGMPISWNFWGTDWNSWRGFVDSVQLTQNEFLEHARELFSNHPIRHVRLGCRLSLEIPCDLGNFFSWENTWTLDEWDHEVSLERSSIHPLIAEFLDDHFDTREQADEALSRACVCYGRKVAGL